MTRVISFCAAVLLVVGLQSATATPVITFNQATGGNGINQGQSVGWQFDVLQSLTLTGLGWFDQNLDGLGLAHTVGIWNPSGTLLGSILVPSGTGAALDGVYRTMSITPILLSPGTGYIVGGENFSGSGDRLAFDVTQVVDSRISFVDATFSSLGSGFVRPTQFSGATTGFYGPMFSATSVPEPGALSLLMLGGALLGFAAKRRAR